MFVPKHPVTRPEVADIRASEDAVDFTELVEKAMEETETLIVKASDPKLI